MSDDTATFVIASGPRATRTIGNVDEVEPELRGLARNMVRWLDPRFPQKGVLGEKVRGAWTESDEAEIEMTQVEELTQDGRGLRIIRLHRSLPTGDSDEGAIRVIAVGAANEAKLELRWNFVVSESAVRGTTAELTVEGPRHTECVADFLSWFEQGGN